VGNEILSTAFPPKFRQKARELTYKFGKQPAKEGYRGYFELDFLIDKKTRRHLAGRAETPRITGASSMTNQRAFAHADAPLFLFHLPWSSAKKKFNLDVERAEQRLGRPAETYDGWTRMVIKHTDDSVDILHEAPEDWYLTR